MTLLAIANGQADQNIRAVRVDTMPLVDGIADDTVWTQVKPIITNDPIAELDVNLKAIYNDTHISFLVHFADATEDRQHKTMVWDKELEIYRTGPKREDVFIFKWSMEAVPVNLTLTADSPYKADIWFWKSHRTDHAGYADDKTQLYASDPQSKAKRLISASGNLFYLVRKGDTGKAAYQAAIYPDYIGDEAPRFQRQIPEGSRADVRAKGNWKEGFWTIEFARRLDTGQPDDVVLNPNNRYRFGVSRYEIAGRKPNARLDQPKYGSGEIGEHLSLIFD